VSLSNGRAHGLPLRHPQSPTLRPGLRAGRPPGTTRPRRSRRPGQAIRPHASHPYDRGAVSFRSAGKTFILVTLHVLYGQDPAQRVPELTAIARWLADWARDANTWDHNLIALGDFNIDRRDDPLYAAFTSTGLQVPADLHLRSIPRTLFSDPEHPDLAKFYDQIAWFTGANAVPALSLRYARGGHFDFAPIAPTEGSPTVSPNSNSPGASPIHLRLRAVQVTTPCGPNSWCAMDKKRRDKIARL